MEVKKIDFPSGDTLGYSADAVFAKGRAFCPSIPIFHKPEPSRRNTRLFPSGVAAGQDATPSVVTCCRFLPSSSMIQILAVPFSTFL